MKSWTLGYQGSEDFIILPAPSLYLSSIIRQYHLQLLQRIQPKEGEEGVKIWPPEHVADEIYRRLKPCFYKVCTLLEQDFWQRWGFEQKIDCDRLNPIDRHLFFVCTLPFEHSSRGMLPGMSGLEQLMGYVYLDAPTEGQGDRRTTGPTTGDNVLDAWVDTMLVFKRNGVQVSKQFSMDECVKACIQASARMQPPQTQEVEETEPWVDNERFVARKSEILAGLQAIDVVPPAGF